jgi:hypothetical protein
MAEITSVLDGLRAAGPTASAQFLPLVHDDPRRLTAHKLAHEAPGQTLDTTALTPAATAAALAQDIHPSEPD